MEYVRLGKILKPLGLKGEVRCYNLTSFPRQRFKKGNVVSLLNEKTGDRTNYTIASMRQSGEVVFLKFAGVTSVEQAETIKGFWIEVNREDAPLPDGYFRLEELKGCEVFSEEGQRLGEVVDVLSYAPTKTLRIQKGDGKTFTVPFLFEHFIVSVDTTAKRIVIHLMEGLL